MRVLNSVLVAACSLFLSSLPADAQRPAEIGGRPQCTGPRSGDAGDCRPLSTGTSRVIIEREIVYIPYPVIVWKRPSADGSMQSEFVNIQNPMAARAFDDFSRSTLQLYQRARVALNRGDCVAAAEYAKAALKRNPPADEIQNLRVAGREAEDCLRKFRKSPGSDVLIIDVPDKKGIIKTLFESTDSRLEPARAKLLPLLKEQAEVKEQVAKLADAVKKSESANAVPALLVQQRAELHQAQAKQKKAEQAVQATVEDLNRTFEIVK